MASSVHSNNKRQKLNNESHTTASSLSKMDDPSLILETVLNCDTLQLGFDTGQQESGQRSFGLASDELDDDDDDDVDDDDDDDDDDDEDDDDDDDDDELGEDDDDDELNEDDDVDDDDDDDDDELYNSKHNGSRGKKRANHSKTKSKSIGTSKSRTTKKKPSPMAKTNTDSTKNPLGINSKLSATSNTNNNGNQNSNINSNNYNNNQVDIQKQLAAAGPAGVAAAAAIATAKKRKRPYSFETNPSIRKRQQTRLIRKLRACIDEYTMRVGQQAVVLITMPGKQMHNYKVFGAQPLESVIRDSKEFIMSHLDQALLEQAPEEIKDDPDKHELPPLVIDGIPTPVEKMTQAQLRAFIPMMLKYSTGRGKPGWGKESTRPAWWPESLPWANVRSDARDEDEKQRISWTTTLRQIVTNCYRFHGRDDLLPSFDETSAENETSTTMTSGNQSKDQQDQQQAYYNQSSTNSANINHANANTNTNTIQQRPLGSRSSGRHRNNNNNNNNNNNHNNISCINSDNSTANLCHIFQTPDGEIKLENSICNNAQQQQQQQSIYSSVANFDTSNVMHTISNGDGTVSLIQVDPANTQILTLPDGTQVRAVRLQTLASNHSDQLNADQHNITLGSNTIINQDQQNHMQTTTATTTTTTLSLDEQNAVNQHHQQDLSTAQTLTISEASLNSEGQIIVTGEDGLQSCYSMSNLVSIPASMYQQFANAGGAQTLSIVNADGSALAGHTISIQAIQDSQQQAIQTTHHQDLDLNQDRDQAATTTLVISDDGGTTNTTTTSTSNNDNDVKDQQPFIIAMASQEHGDQQQLHNDEAIDRAPSGNKNSHNDNDNNNDDDNRSSNTQDQLLIQESTTIIKQEGLDEPQHQSDSSKQKQSSASNPREN